MSNLAKKYITRIEGHGNIDIDFKNNKARLLIEEGERLFEALLVNHPYYDAPHITSRICGVCPTSHLLASIKAIENAFNINPEKTTILLRQILLSAQICQSHTLHLFFLTAPDYLRVAGSIEMIQKNPEIFNLGLHLKNLYDEVIEIIGGRAVHPQTPAVGGFTKIPTKDQLFLIKEKLELSLVKAEETVKLFTSFSYPEIYREVEMMALRNDETYPYYDGIIWDSEGFGFAPTNYQSVIDEIIKPYSTAKFGIKKNDQSGFICGARARIALFGDYLNDRAGAITTMLTKKIGPYNSFYNNIAQSIEVLHFTEEMIKLIDELVTIIDSHRNIEFKPIQSVGVGVIEAPRGLLYHKYEFNSDGIIEKVDIITPTVQNLTSIEDDINEFLITNQNLDQEKKKKIIEMLIRAFDPCITCSVH